MIEPSRGPLLDNGPMIRAVGLSVGVGRVGATNQATSTVVTHTSQPDMVLATGSTHRPNLYDEPGPATGPPGKRFLSILPP